MPSCAVGAGIVLHCGLWNNGQLDTFQFVLQPSYNFENIITVTLHQHTDWSTQSSVKIIFYMVFLELFFSIYHILVCPNVPRFCEIFHIVSFDGKMPPYCTFNFILHGIQTISTINNLIYKCYTKSLLKREKFDLKLSHQSGQFLRFLYCEFSITISHISLVTFPSKVPLRMKNYSLGVLNQYLCDT